MALAEIKMLGKGLIIKYYVMRNHINPTIENLTDFVKIEDFATFLRYTHE